MTKGKFSGEPDFSRLPEPSNLDEVLNQATAQKKPQKQEEQQQQDRGADSTTAETKKRRPRQSKQQKEKQFKKTISKLAPEAVVGMDIDVSESDTVDFIEEKKKLKTAYEVATERHLEKLSLVMAEEIASTNSIEELLNFIDSQPGLQGSMDYFDKDQLRYVIEGVQRGELGYEYITRTGGLRQKVYDLLEKEKTEKEMIADSAEEIQEPSYATDREPEALVKESLLERPLTALPEMVVVPKKMSPPVNQEELIEEKEPEEEIPVRVIVEEVPDLDTKPIKIVLPKEMTPPPRIPRTKEDSERIKNEPDPSGGLEGMVLNFKAGVKQPKVVEREPVKKPEIKPTANNEGEYLEIPEAPNPSKEEEKLPDLEALGLIKEAPEVEQQIVEGEQQNEFIRRLSGLDVILTEKREEFANANKQLKILKSEYEGKMKKPWNKFLRNAFGFGVNKQDKKLSELEAARLDYEKTKLEFIKERIRERLYLVSSSTDNKERLNYYPQKFSDIEEYLDLSTLTEEERVQYDELAEKLRSKKGTFILPNLNPLKFYKKLNMILAVEKYKIKTIEKEVYDEVEQREDEALNVMLGLN